MVEVDHHPEEYHPVLPPLADILALPVLPDFPDHQDPLLRAPQVPFRLVPLVTPANPVIPALLAHQVLPPQKSQVPPVFPDILVHLNNPVPPHRDPSFISANPVNPVHQDPVNLDNLANPDILVPHHQDLWFNPVNPVNPYNRDILIPHHQDPWFNPVNPVPLQQEEPSFITASSINREVVAVAVAVPARHRRPTATNSAEEEAGPTGPEPSTS